MTEPQTTLDQLRQTGFFAAIKWAGESAFSLTRTVFRPEYGHDQAVLGTLNFVHFRQMLDFVAATGNFAGGSAQQNPLPLSEEHSLDVVDWDSLPKLLHGTITRRDYKGSPGWATHDQRILLQSFRYGHVEKINWNQKSSTKKRVAAQEYRDRTGQFRVSDLEQSMVAGIPNGDDFAGSTFIVAHSCRISESPDQAQELYIGRSKLPQSRNDPCWHWLLDMSQYSLAELKPDANTTLIREVRELTQTDDEHVELDEASRSRLDQKLGRGDRTSN